MAVESAAGFHLCEGSDPKPERVVVDSADGFPLAEYLQAKVESIDGHDKLHSMSSMRRFFLYMDSVGVFGVVHAIACRAHVC